MKFDLDRWITDEAGSQRFPLYTRANADEVGPDPFSPLGWTLAWRKGCIPGTAGGFVAFGVVHWHEVGGEESPTLFGNWGGYFYNPMSLSRLMGVRMPGATAEAIDQAYFGDHPGVPPYVADPRDEDEGLSVKLGETMAWVMSTDGFPEVEKWNERSRAAKAARPDLSSLANGELVAYARSMAPNIAGAWVPYCQVCLGASLGPGAVQAICSGVGRPADAVRVMASVGGVDSADASLRMWDLSRMIAGSTTVSAQFDSGVDGLEGRLRTSTEADTEKFVIGLDDLLTEFGHRGPNEWDLRPHSWETDPSIVLGMLDHLRRQSDKRSPYVAATAAAAERERIAAELTELTADDEVAQGTLVAGMRSAAIWLALRERGKNTVIRFINEAKVALLELGGRMTEAGVLHDPQAIFMLTDDELDSFLADPRAYTAVVGERDATFQALHDVEPPYIVDVSKGVAPISTWPRRGASASIDKAEAGTVLHGAQGSPGIVTGRAKIVLDPGHAGDLEPDDIMVVHTTDPSWTPLFLSVAGVVCNVGAVASHAVIVSRELGIPCAVSVVNATSRILDGSTIRVDGSTGTVEVLAVPTG